MATRALTVDGVTLDLEVTRKRVKNVNARLHGDRLTVSAPLGVPQAELDAVIEQLARRLVRRVRARRLNRDDGPLTLARRIAVRFPAPLAVEDVRFVTTTRRRWGSYSQRTRVVRLHAALRQLPEWVLEAVLAHELAHAVHPDHSAAFWRLLREVCPDTDRARAFLEGVTWVADRWESLPGVERAQLCGR